MVSEISILIPVYNQNVTALVESLLLQAKALPITFEIRVYDDGSNPQTKSLNQPLAHLPQVVYQELPQNIGRSQIRTLLAQEATFETLLFLDNDVAPVHPDFLARYAQQHQNTVTVGGVAYQPKLPKGLELRWKYGKAREEAPAQIRQKNPYQRLFSSNFMVNRGLFFQYFPIQEIRGYGHEDTLFAYRLQVHQVPVHHIDNPVWHLGLEPAGLFLLKTNEAILNLVLLQRQNQLGPEGKLWQTYLSLKKWKLTRLFSENSTWLLPFLKRNLVSSNPNLRFFDLYRLLLLDRYIQKTNKLL